MKVPLKQLRRSQMWREALKIHLISKSKVKDSAGQTRSKRAEDTTRARGTGVSGTLAEMDHPDVGGAQTSGLRRLQKAASQCAELRGGRSGRGPPAFSWQQL